MRMSVEYGIATHLNDGLHLRTSTYVGPVMNNNELTRLAVKFLQSLFQLVEVNLIVERESVHH